MKPVDTVRGQGYRTSDSINEPAQDKFLSGPRSVALEEFFGGVGFFSCRVVRGRKGAEHAVDARE